LTLKHHFGKLEGLTLAIIGDIAHSRVAASNMILLRQFGVNVRVIAPKTLMPEKLPAEGIERYNSLADGLKRRRCRDDDPPAERAHAEKPD
jgi:aspartate carbamoyltransferase catalytic subunit